jgi:hypothetical protein
MSAAGVEAMIAGWAVAYIRRSRGGKVRGLREGAAMESKKLWS